MWSGFDPPRWQRRGPTHPACRSPPSPLPLTRTMAEVRQAGGAGARGGRGRRWAPQVPAVGVPVTRRHGVRVLVPVPGERQPPVGCHDRRRSTKGSRRPPARPLCLSLLTHAQRTTTPVPAPRRAASPASVSPAFGRAPPAGQIRSRCTVSSQFLARGEAL